MKKILMILGGVFLTLVVIGAIGIAVISTKGNALDKESKKYVDRVAPIILSNLTKETLFKYSDAQLKASAKPEEFDKLFKMFSKLGRFKEYKESMGQAHISITNKGKSIYGKYVAKVDFETGPATLKITTVKKGSNWKIFNFHIDSMALLNQ